MLEMILGTLAILICVAAFFINRNYNNRLLKIFPYYLLFTASVQLSGYLYSHFLKKSNHFIFNLDLLIDTGFWTLFFAFTYQSKKLKKVILAAGIIFLLYAIFRLYQESFWIYNSVNDTISSVLITAYCLVFLAELFISDLFINYFSIPVFWICTGLLFFNAGEIVYLCLFNYIDSHKLDPQGKIYALLLTTLNLIMYGLFTVGSFSQKLWKKNS